MRTDLPNIRAVSPGRARELTITWKGGVESDVDLTDHLSAYVVFASLREDAAAFRAASVGDWGWSIHWSDDMEISSDTLWRLTLEQGAAWLRRWRLDHDMTQAEAASAVGVSSRMWRYYEAGEHPLPKTVRLACAGLDAEARAA
jgi:DNA-binding XRE family transcriptional regulator